MRRLALIGIAVATLVGCAKTATVDDSGAPGSPLTTIVGGMAPNGIHKTCDAGRAIYVYEADRSGGIAVVEAAPECQQR